MKTDNHTPWAAFATPLWTVERKKEPVLVVKTGFTWDEQGNLTPMKQSDIPFEQFDRFNNDDPQNHSMAAAGDYVPFKNGFELLLFGTAYSVKPVPMFEVSAQIQEPNGKTVWEKQLYVLGPHHWQRNLFGWVTSIPEPITELPLQYEFSYGGMADKNQEKLCEYNPAGQGYVVESGRALPQIQNKPLISQKKHKPEPVGFGPLASHWQPRKAAFDALNNSDAFGGGCPYKYVVDRSLYNVAPADQQLTSIPANGSILTLRNLDAKRPVQQVKLPVANPKAKLSGGESIALTYDTLIIDADKKELYQVWRGTVPLALKHMNSQDIQIVDLTLNEEEGEHGDA